jgi:SM-20-related protein
LATVDAASTITRDARFWCDIDAFEKTALVAEPFPYVIVPGFIPPRAIGAIDPDFPVVAKVGSFPLPSLKYGPAFAAMIDALCGPEFTAAVARKFAIDLEGRPTMVTVRGKSGTRDGHIHTDSVTKLITVLIYLNGKWESPEGRLRLLRSPDNLDDVVAEVPPDEGTLLVFKNVPHAWHGYKPFNGDRRVIQLNWVTSNSVVRWEQTRHRVSAMFKGLKRAGA